MLTPLDIHNREFKRCLRGYDIDEVDGFLDEVIRDFETLYKESLELKEVIEKKDESINRYKELEQTLQNTLVLAQQTGEEAKQNAKKEAELIVWEAKKKAEQMFSKAQEEIIESTKKLEGMRGLEKQLYVKMKSFLLTQLEYMESYDVEKQVQDKQAAFESKGSQERQVYIEEQEKEVEGSLKEREFSESVCGYSAGDLQRNKV
ncbi:MAG: DivIVA domain-containing protein [Clostridia bacterium]|nr:DivIVA domain-containing protein [Clostridia bacterium]MDD4145840.1 DivIVA domain-containing protein [Clostridia bacterium]MDD4665117.1 DivIVA domain-containing protein [Clostridia bacterium]